ncbi:MAG: HD domain-containing phosphohydrolase [Bacillota bacterium]
MEMLSQQYVAYLLELVKKINSSLNLHELLETINQELTDLLKVEASAILVFDSRDEELYFLQAGQFRGRNVTGIKVPIQGSIAGWVIQHMQTVYVNDPQHDPRHYKKIDQYYNFTTKNLAAIPLLVKGKVIGVLEVINKARDGFDEHDIAFLAELAHYIAIALENAKLYESSRNQLKSSFAAFSSAIDKRDSYTHFHSRRVRDYALVFAAELNITESQYEHLELAAILHDVGKIGIRDDILLKPGQLSHDEYLSIKEHPLKGAEILSLLEGISGEILQAVRHHHEHWDGNGYPEGLAGEKIPLLARIVALCDVFDALTTDRPYRRRMKPGDAKKLIMKNKGVMFDPALVDVFYKTYPDILAKGKFPDN